MHDLHEPRFNIMNYAIVHVCEYIIIMDRDRDQGPVLPLVSYDLSLPYCDTVGFYGAPNWFDPTKNPVKIPVESSSGTHRFVPTKIRRSLIRRA